MPEPWVPTAGNSRTGSGRRQFDESGTNRQVKFPDRGGQNSGGKIGSALGQGVESVTN